MITKNTFLSKSAARLKNAGYSDRLSKLADAVGILHSSLVRKLISFAVFI
ncbi:MAG: hypothetical protein Q4F85_05300 [Prevotella sp.]|nr:hypothetical protein [Prevotella sp.]